MADGSETNIERLIDRPIPGWVQCLAHEFGIDQFIAVVGVGEIGRAVTHHIHDGGYDVTVYDTGPEAVAEFEDIDVSIADSPAQSAEADLSLIAVGTYEQVESVLVDGGLFSSADPMHVVRVVSTVVPQECIALQERADEHDIEIVDVPVCRGEQTAVAGKLLVLDGGDQEVFECVPPVLEQFADSEKIVYLGPIGSGQVGKACNYVLLWTNVVANYEVLSLI